MYVGFCSDRNSLVPGVCLFRCLSRCMPALRPISGSRFREIYTITYLYCFSVAPCNLLCLLLHIYSRYLSTMIWTAFSCSSSFCVQRGDNGWIMQGSVQGKIPSGERQPICSWFRGGNIRESQRHGDLLISSSLTPIHFHWHNVLGFQISG